MKVAPEPIEVASSHCSEQGKTYCMNLSAPFIIQVLPFKAILMKTMPNVHVCFGCHWFGGRSTTVTTRFVLLSIVCEPSWCSWALKTSVALECSCSVPLGVKVVAVDDPYRAFLTDEVRSLVVFVFSRRSVVRNLTCI